MLDVIIHENERSIKILAEAWGKLVREALERDSVLYRIWKKEKAIDAIRQQPFFK